MSKIVILKERRIDIGERLFATVWDILIEGKDKVIATVFDEEDEAPNYDDIVKLLKEIDIKYKVQRYVE